MILKVYNKSYEFDDDVPEEVLYFFKKKNERNSKRYILQIY